MRKRSVRRNFRKGCETERIWKKCIFGQCLPAFSCWWMHWDTSSYGTDGTKKRKKKQSAEKHSGFTEATVEVLRDQVLLLGCQRHQRRAVFYGPVASRSDLSPPLVLDVLEPRNIGTRQHTASSIAPPAAIIQSMLKPPPDSQVAVYSVRSIQHPGRFRRICCSCPRLETSEFTIRLKSLKCFKEERLGIVSCPYIPYEAWDANTKKAQM